MKTRDGLGGKVVRKGMPGVQGGVVVGGAAAVVLLAGVELFCRLVLGLGDPPLSVVDPDTEYRFKPSAVYHRFGRTVKYNSWSMRSDEFVATKSDPSEFRVLVLGDSIINGGALTDQARLATSVLQRRLQTRLGRKVVVGNASAGSWGPPNMAAYLRKFGTFEADALVVVLSSHDYLDCPTWEPTVGVHPDFPDRKPWSATWELCTRYMPRYLQFLRPNRAAAASDWSEARALDQCLGAVREIVLKGHGDHCEVLIAQHRARSELGRPPTRGHEMIALTAQSAGALLIDLGPAFEVAIKKGLKPYRDDLHPNDLGQELIADRLEPVLEGIARGGGSYQSRRPR